MTHKIYLDSWRTKFVVPPHNSSLGNKILHLYFCINYANKHGLEIRIPHPSNLDKIFDTTELIEYNDLAQNIFTEPTAHSTTNLETIFTDSKFQFLEESFFLDDKLTSTKDVFVKGHFYHYDLMPTIDIVNRFLDYNQSNYLSAMDITKEYQELNKNVIFVHYRGTDFINHENRMGDCRLPSTYYDKAFEIAKTDFKKPLFLCLSDEPDFFLQFKAKHDIEILNNSYEVDWFLLHLTTKMISSNSSFSWTAALHNKDFLVQPSSGLYPHSSPGKQIPYGSHIKGSILV